MSALAARLGVRHVSGASSGRAALCVVLRSLHGLRPERTVVALPAYTCFSVAASIVRAGLKLYPLEMDPETLEFDRPQLEALPADRLLCILTSNLFGFVSDAAHIRRVARARGAFVVDNAAQALGAWRDGQPAGTGGDAGIFSLGRGKALPAGEGGLIVTNNEAISWAIEAETRNLHPASPAHAAYLLFQLTGYSAFLRPGLYWIPDALPFLKLGATEFDPRFPIRTLHPLSRELLLVLLNRLDAMNETRRLNARRLIEALGGSRLLYFPQPSPDAQPTMVRLPVVARDARTRRLAITRLRRAGIGASPFYPSAICDIAGIERHMASANYHRPKAEHLAQTLFTLPVHPFVKQRDIARMIGILRALPAEVSRAEAGCQEPSITDEDQAAMVGDQTGSA
ncbi:MAG TPA: DegT/DnrJ/EryC1/StrS family aminotransferase [Patescibacteria group bacterium]|nr:DegT/DnrJ/EryC1/StrS family aminotransferase [Patescibacteria group bacterium]